MTVSDTVCYTCTCLLCMLQCFICGVDSQAMTDQPQMQCGVCPGLVVNSPRFIWKEKVLCKELLSLRMLLFYKLKKRFIWHPKITNSARIFLKSWDMYNYRCYKDQGWYSLILGGRGLWKHSISGCLSFTSLLKNVFPLK